MGKWEKFINSGSGVLSCLPSVCGMSRPSKKGDVFNLPGAQGSGELAVCIQAQTTYHWTRHRVGAGRREFSSSCSRPRPRTPAQAPARRRGGQAFPR